MTLAVKKRSSMYTVCLLTILVKGLSLTGEPSMFFWILDLAPDDPACNSQFLSLKILPSLASFHAFSSSFPSFCSVLVVLLFSTSSAYVFVCPPARPWLQPLPGRRSAAEVFEVFEQRCLQPCPDHQQSARYLC